MTEGRVEIHDEFPNSHHDPLIRKLHTVIHYCLRALAVLMVVVIMLGVLDVVYVGYQAISSSYVFAIAAVVLALGLAYFLSPARRTGGATVEWHRCRYRQGPRSQQTSISRNKLCLLGEKTCRLAHRILANTYGERPLW